MKVREQISLLHEADLLLSMHGAGMGNMFHLPIAGPTSTTRRRRRRPAPRSLCCATVDVTSVVSLLQKAIKTLRHTQTCIHPSATSSTSSIRAILHLMNAQPAH